MDCSKRPFDKGLDPLLLPALRVQRATNAELEVVADVPWGTSLGARVSDDLFVCVREATGEGRGGGGRGWGGEGRGGKKAAKNRLLCLLDVTLRLPSQFVV